MTSITWKSLFSFTCAARSTLIFEKDVRYRCSYFSFGTRDNPGVSLSAPMPLAYTSFRCCQLITLSLHFIKKQTIPLEYGYTGWIYPHQPLVAGPTISHSLYEVWWVRHKKNISFFWCERIFGLVCDGAIILAMHLENFLFTELPSHVTPHQSFKGNNHVN